MLCRFCQTLDFDAACSKQGAAHHESRADLDASAAAGCELCVKIRLAQPADREIQKIRWFYDSDNSELYWASYPYKVDDVIARVHVCTTHGMFLSTLEGADTMNATYDFNR